MLKKFKLFASYILCLFVPKSFCKAINESVDPSELDVLIVENSGIK